MLALTPVAFRALVLCTRVTYPLTHSCSPNSAPWRLKGKRMVDDKGLNRRGAIKKYRGRLNLELSFQKASAFSVLILNIKVTPHLSFDQLHSWE